MMIKLLSLLVFFFFMTSCGLKVGNIDIGKMYDTASAVSDANKDYSKEEEIKIGQVISAQFLGSSKYYNNDSIQQYVNHVGQWLVMQLPEQNYDWHFVVLEDEMFNAYTAPAGMVFINTGLLEQLHTEAQLAAVLSHEIIHAYRNHHMKTIQSSAETKAWSNAISLAADYSHNKHINRGKALWDSVGSQITNIYFRGFDKELELEADYQGLFLLTKAGYDPYAMVEVLQIIQGIAPDDIWFKQFYNTHPEPSERIAFIFNTVQLELSDIAPVAISQKRYASMKPH